MAISQDGQVFLAATDGNIVVFSPRNGAYKLSVGNAR